MLKFPLVSTDMKLGITSYVSPVYAVFRCLGCLRSAIILIFDTFLHWHLSLISALVYDYYNREAIEWSFQTSLRYHDCPAITNTTALSAHRRVQGVHYIVQWCGDLYQHLCPVWAYSDSSHVKFDVPEIWQTDHSAWCLQGRYWSKKPAEIFAGFLFCFVFKCT